MSPLPFKTHAPQIFDRSLRTIRQRNNQSPTNHPLHELLHELTLERLSFIQRDFESTLIIGEFSPLRKESRQSNVIRIQSTTPTLQAQSEFLPFAPDTFDLVISYFDLHMINDIPGSLAQVNQILKPDGLFLGIFLGGDSLWQLRQVCQTAELDMRNGISPRVAPTVSLYDAAALLQRTRFALPVADHEKLEWTYDSALDLLKDLKALGLSNCLTQQQRGLMGKTLFKKILDTYDTQFALPNSTQISCCYDIVFLSGWAPSPTQQIPLPRGSATNRLSQVL